MSRRPLPLLALLALVAALLQAPVGQTGALPSASAAKAEPWAYLSYAGGTMVRALGTTISSDLTSQSTISGTKLPNKMTSSVAEVKVAPNKLVHVSAVKTRTQAKKLKKGAKLVTRSRTGKVKLLGGLIQADAVVTKNVTKGTPKGLAAHSDTRFVNLRIAGAQLPIDLPENFRIVIPGVAMVEANVSQVAQKHGVATNTGYALAVWLLSDRGPAPIGSRIILNPTYSLMSVPVPNDNPALGGFAFGTDVNVVVTDAVKGQVGRTAQATTPPNGTGGRKDWNRTAEVNVPGVVRVGAVESFTSGKARKGYGRIVNQNRIAGVDLFNGLITADAIKVRAKSTYRSGKFKPKEKLTFVNLTIAGRKIPVNIGKNTTINVAGLGRVVLNQRIRKDGSNKIRGLYVKVLEPGNGVEVGATIELAVAATWVWK
ncbi:choice-of-anchor P family protein [Nocardioides alcanivorans]|uniref:choice-of-anchor P family protein n=1 Tax=Nocardioides alcanivorans TaxID=2897352 RepID=UPI001F2BA612|nr:choice-of-anchor P family protein [Nocardioides alcanivorans]